VVGLLVLLLLLLLLLPSVVVLAMATSSAALLVPELLLLVLALSLSFAAAFLGVFFRIYMSFIKSSKHYKLSLVVGEWSMISGTMSVLVTLSAVCM
jgi:glucan phosphoethanolaminetransferase (alkaline phosphatase superfamily)